MVNRKLSASEFRKTIKQILRTFELLNYASLLVCPPCLYKIVETNNPNIFRVRFYSSVFQSNFISLISVLGCFSYIQPFYDDVIIFNYGYYTGYYLKSEGIVRKSDK